MSTNASSEARVGPGPERLRILHCMRAPVGGLFRHVFDLACEQAERGHAVGIVADKNSADPLTVDRLNAIKPKLKLGLALVPMRRQPGLGDIGAARLVTRHARASGAQVLHGHGAKGGAYARLAGPMLHLAGQKAAVFYTPHGGSLHYAPGTLPGTVFIGLERVLRLATDGLIFESDFARRAYAARIGTGSVPVRVIPNGLTPEDFTAATPDADAADFLFVGELRHLKGVDVLLSALAELNAKRPVRAVIVGAGPEAGLFRNMARSLGLEGRVTFPGAMPARRAFGLGSVLVVPSRAESLPYIVLEAGAAGLPVIASDVGGIPEIVAGTAMRLVPAGDAGALAGAMEHALASPDEAVLRAVELKRQVSERFTVAAMTDAVLGFYATTLGR